MSIDALRLLSLLIAAAAIGCSSDPARRAGPTGPGADGALLLDGGECGTEANREGCPCDAPGTTRGCYDGPIEARGVGLCRDGMQACVQVSEFAVWGRCEGARGPAAEQCAGGEDEDCDGRVDCKDSDCSITPVCLPECAPGDVAPCYTGPAGTSGVGVCRPGRRTCSPDGRWGACMGEVKPGSEGLGTCKDGLDNDCNGLTDCQELICLIVNGSTCAPQICTPGATQACYTGPAGTDGVGPCHGGTQACAQDGKSWGACTGQVLPENEGLSCADQLDNDCNGQKDCADWACVTAPTCCVPSAGSTPADTTIWAHSPDTLYRVDPSTFALTTVGDFGAGDSMTDLAVTPDGKLYSISFSTLYLVDKNSGKATGIASLSGSVNNGLTFLPDGTLLASDGSGEVKRMNPNTGALMSIGTFANGLSSSGDLVAVGNVMYGISATAAGGNDASDNNVLLRVDIATGKAQVVGPIGFGKVWGLAYVNTRVIAFSNSGQIIQVDPATGQGTLITTKAVQFWGAGMSPLVPPNTCP